jgi:squalene cyclase
MNDPNVAAVQLALDRAQRVLWKTQRADGSWDAKGDVGAWVTAQVVAMLRYVQALNPADTAAAVTYLTGQQRADGGFAIHPYSHDSELCATACGWAALHLCQATEAAAKARAFVQSHGGVSAVIDKMNEGDMAIMFLAMAGLVDAAKVPCPSSAALLVPPVKKFLQTRFHSGVLMGSFATEVLLKRLRGDFGPDGRTKSLFDSLICRGAIANFKVFQNQNGSWNGSTVNSVLILPALFAINTPESKAMLDRALAWVETQKLRDASGVHFGGFSTESWATGFETRALLYGGISPNDPDLTRALEWMARSQLTIPMPAVDNRKANAVLLGGYGFQHDNHTMPDCDDTAVVLSAMGMALEDPTLPSDLRARLAKASSSSKQWLFSMQNPDGGWSAYVWGLPERTVGPIMQTNARIDMSDPMSILKAVLNPPPVTGDPSTEDLTGRVLHCMGHLGEQASSSPAIAHAIEFLKRQQRPTGPWWGRWVLNYVSSTAFVLMGLRAVGVDFKEPWVQRAVQWVLSKQNPDGGWGEGPESYRDEATAGVGPTMVPLTALVVMALLDVGEGDHPKVKRAISLLLDTQRADGTWPNGQYLHTNVPPDTFYVYEEACRFYPPEALGKYLAHRAQRSTAGDERVRWNNDVLDALRQAKDPEADQVVADIFARGATGAVNSLMNTIFRSDEPVPAGLPMEAAAYFERVSLPSWADRRQLALAEQLFTRTGWQVAMGLFCSSLPQAYAAGNGATVIGQTQGMTKHVKQRIFETAQFLFDVMDVGALEPGGRGVRTAQKVRLMHAAIRHLLLTRDTPKWDSALLGQPINQEDLAGTLMTFSVVTLDALRLLQVPYSSEEAEAWLHAWKVVGHLLGVRDEVLPVDLIDAQELMEAIRDRQWRASDSGKALAAALVEMMQSYYPKGTIEGFPVALMRTLAGDHCANLLGLPPADWTRKALDMATQLAQFIPQADPRSPTAKLFAFGTHFLMEGIIAVQREGKNAKFRIPDSLMNTVDPNF